jgi:hypothetical protein
MEIISPRAAWFNMVANLSAKASAGAFSVKLVHMLVLLVP